MSRRSEPSGNPVDINRLLGATLAILEALAVVLVVAGIITGLRGKVLLSLGATELVLAGTACLIAAPMFALLPVAAHFLSKKSRAGWYALGTLAITVIGLILAAR